MNKDTIRKWWDIFVGDGNFTEVRILGNVQYSGYFKSCDNLIKCLEPYAEMDGEQIYFTLNELYHTCYERPQKERILQSTYSTKDTDIIRRKWILVDFDPIREDDAKKVSSTNEELQASNAKMREVYKFLREQGFSDPVVCCSGNGFHLTYKVDMPTDEDTKSILKKFFTFLRQKFNDGKTDIDPKNVNASRVCKLYGTVAKKGANTNERPWRESTIIHVPSTIAVTPIEKFEALAKLAVDKPTPKPVNQQSVQFQQQFSLTDWLTSYGINYRTKSHGDSTMYELEWCPWVDTHSEKKRWDSALFQDSDGKITFNCHHSHCEGKTWHDFRTHFQPDAYDRQYTPQQKQYESYRLPHKPKYEFKEENDELGKKWLCTKDVKKIDLSQLEMIHTGFYELDKAIKGLILGEVTIVSGSNSSGKSSWLNCVMLNARNFGYKTALWSGELPKEMLVAWLQMAAAGNHVEKSKYNDGYYVPNAVIEKIDRWLDGWFYLYNNEYGNKWEQIFKDMEELIKADVKLFILDNLFSLDIDLFEGDNNKKQKDLVMQICRFAKHNNVHIVLVAHPRKSMAFLRKDDISGTSDIGNAADNIFIVHRNNNDFQKRATEFFGAATFAQMELGKYGNIVEVCKCRMFGNAVDSMCGMYYDLRTRQFTNEPSQLIEYGWATEQETTITEEYTVPEEPQPLPTTIQPNQSFDTPLAPLYTQKEDDAYWGQFQHDSEMPF